jgi:hypothetical protein
MGAVQTFGDPSRSTHRLSSQGESNDPARGSLCGKSRRNVAPRDLLQKISQISGVGLVGIGGQQKPAIRIDPQALAARGINLEDLRTVLGQATRLRECDPACHAGTGDGGGGGVGCGPQAIKQQSYIRFATSFPPGQYLLRSERVRIFWPIGKTVRLR